MTGARGLRLVRDPGSDSARTTALLAEWELWLRAAGQAEKTIETRKAGVRTLCLHAGTDDPTTITERQLVAWLGGCNAQWTRYTYAATAKVWFRWLVDRGYRDDNPTTGLPRLRTPRGTPRPVTTDALTDVLGVAPRKARAYILLAAYAGLRVHEIAKLQGEDFADEWLYVTGKGGVKAAIPVHPVLEQLRRGFPAQGYWFPSTSELGHVRPQAVSSTIGRTFRQAGHEMNAHQLRHWFGTWLQRMSKDIRVTQELMRHASLRSTQIYTEVSEQSQIDAVRRLQ